ncbi:MAG: chitobiase/beta-hexosaminidase C-terminal domain-containing protein [Candidatus Acidiferrum sp.]
MFRRALHVHPHNAPATVSIINGASVPFIVSITSTAAAGTMSSPFAPSYPTFPSTQTSAAVFLALLSAFCLFQLAASRRHIATAHYPHALRTVAAASFLAAILASGIACGGASGSSTPQRQADPAPTTLSATATPLLQAAGGTFSTGYSTVTITDATSGASIYFTTDGSAPIANSPLYSAPLTVNTSGTTIQAISTAPSYSNSAVATASYKFQTPSGTFPITLMPTATVTGSAKQTQLSPITLTLTVK